MATVEGEHDGNLESGDMISLERDAVKASGPLLGWSVELFARRDSVERPVLR